MLINVFSLFFKNNYQNFLIKKIKIFTILITILENNDFINYFNIQFFVSFKLNSFIQNFFNFLHTLNKKRTKLIYF